MMIITVRETDLRIKAPHGGVQICENVRKMEPEPFLKIAPPVDFLLFVSQLSFVTNGPMHFD